MKSKSSNLTRASKFLSLVLRHRPDKIGITLDDKGWTSVKDLLKKANNLTMEELEFIVKNNNKKRFEFNEKKTKIRARQGHSVKVDLGYKECEPPEILYHGTARRFHRDIMHGGLKKMSRHAVHLSADRSTADNVGRRHGKLLVYVVHAKEMYNAGEKFYLSNNGVWLTDKVEPKYLSIATGFYVVRSYDGSDHVWTDVTGPVTKAEAEEVWNKRTDNGTRNTCFADIDYTAIFPAGTRMIYSAHEDR